MSVEDVRNAEIIRVSRQDEVKAPYNYNFCTEPDETGRSNTKGESAYLHADSPFFLLHKF